jgi:hypothetical protein
MALAKYAVNNQPVQTLLSYIEAKEIAIPEIQRPFVWDASQVRDLLDSLYHGYPIGYLIVWQNPAVKLKDGSKSNGKKILIDGQQRVTALMASVLGRKIINKKYNRTNIRIAFNPLEEKFEVSNTAIQKDKRWIPDISEILENEFKTMKFVQEYCTANEIEDQDSIFNTIHHLLSIKSNQIGIIELDSSLDIEKVTEIFIRINSKGAELSQADFVMSKIAANEDYGGNLLRKLVDYFCHLAVAPEYFDDIAGNDKEFAATEYLGKIRWLKNENEDLYDPSYTDLLRVAFTSEFRRGRLRELVALLSGRNFETREYESEIAEKSFDRLRKGALHFVNETNFKNFVMILKSAGFISSSLIGSQNAVNFAYIIYLILKSEKTHPAKIEELVSRWYVMSILTNRYAGNPEGSFDYDIKRINNYGVEKYLEDEENGQLSDAFWQYRLTQKFNTSVASSPYFRLYIAAQVKLNDKGFLSKSISISDLVLHKGDIHHIFPKNYLKKHNYTRGQYNQIANYVLMQSEINIAISDKSPSEYFDEIYKQCNNGDLKYGGIHTINELKENLRQQCIPENIDEMQIDDYENFLENRRKLMALKIKNYYKSLKN